MQTYHVAARGDPVFPKHFLFAVSVTVFTCHNIVLGFWRRLRMDMCMQL